MRAQGSYCTLFCVEMKNLFLSGRWESNPVYTHPKRVYYRYTTARNEESWKLAYTNFQCPGRKLCLRPVSRHPSRNAADVE